MGEGRRLPDGGAAGRRILVVEHDYFVAEDLRQELEGHGLEVLGPVASLADAKDLLARGERPTAALLVSLRGGPSDEG